MVFSCPIGSAHLIQILAIFSVCFSSIGNGMHYAWTSPSIPKLVQENSTGITIENSSYFLIFQAIVFGISAPFLSMVIDKISRKSAVLLNAVPQMIAWILIACCRNIWLLYLAKAITGIVDAWYYATVPIYICEISEPDVRHTWINLISIALYFGIFLINVIGSLFEITETAWICFCFSGLHIIAFSWVPESPYYLLMKDDPDSARNALQVLRKSSDVEDELNLIAFAVKRQITESGTWSDLFGIKSNRRAVFIVCGVRVLQQLSGLTTFEVYSQYMFQEADVKLSPSSSAIVFSGMLFIGPGLSAFIVNRFGRRPLLILSSLGCGLSLTAEALYFTIKHFTAINVSQLYWFPLAGMICFVIFCSVGLASVPVLIVGEMLSASIKSKAMVVYTLVFALCEIVIPKLFQVLTDSIALFLPFLLFAVSCFLGVLFLWTCVIETKGKTLEEIQQELKAQD